MTSEREYNKSLKVSRNSYTGTPFTSELALRIIRVVFGPYLGVITQILPQVFLFDCIRSVIGCWRSYGYNFGNFHIAKTGVNVTVNYMEAFSDRSFLETLSLQRFETFVLYSVLIAIVGYWGIGAAFYVSTHKRPNELQYAYDVKRKDDNSWKTQPKRSATFRLEWITDVWKPVIGNAILIGIGLCYIWNGGPRSRVYFRWRNYPLWWNILQYPLFFLYMDYVSYWQHRLVHHRYLYKRIHYIHHKYTPQRALVSLSGHWLDFIPFFQNNFTFVFVVPLYWFTVGIFFLYLVYNFTIDHTGVNFKAPWWMPWKHDVIYHDFHHRFPNKNFGVFSPIWDIVFETGKLELIRKTTEDEKNRAD